MKIIEFKELIRNIPYEYHSFEITKSNWENTSQREIVSKIFKGREKISINRSDILCGEEPVEVRIVKILMWGYPTKGRGKNIDNILENDNFQLLQELLTPPKSLVLTVKEIKGRIKEIKGLGISTLTKLLYFFKIKLNQKHCLILDEQIIRLINQKRYKELSPLIGIKRSNAMDYYPNYLDLMDELSNEIICKPDQVELFLYQFGRNLRYERKD